jgi:hypothetical protein
MCLCARRGQGRAVRYAVALRRQHFTSSDLCQLWDPLDFSDPDHIPRGTVIQNVAVSPALTFILEYFIVTLITYHSY